MKDSCKFKIGDIVICTRGSAISKRLVTGATYKVETIETDGRYYLVNGWDQDRFILVKKKKRNIG